MESGISFWRLQCLERKGNLTRLRHERPTNNNPAFHIWCGASFFFICQVSAKSEFEKCPTSRSFTYWTCKCIPRPTFLTFNIFFKAILSLLCFQKKTSKIESFAFITFLIKRNRRLRTSRKLFVSVWFLN